MVAVLAAIGITLLFSEVQLLGSKKISFSHSSGFYDDDFELEIDCGSLYDIYYTLDGSEPTADSIRYQRGNPIVISDASRNPNQYTARMDLVPAEYPAFWEEAGFYAPPYSVPSEKVDKCTVIRAAAFSEGKRAGEIVSGVYFVGWENRPEYKDVYIASLVVDPDDLFDYEKGIMVTGKLYDEYKAEKEAMYLSDPTQKLSLKKWWWCPANYHQSGMDWERPAEITVFNTNLEKEMDQSCGIRIHGGASRGSMLKSVRCYARIDYSGRDYFDVDWFGEGVYPNKFLLFSGGNEATINLKDYMISDLTKDMNFATMEYIPCAVFINGEFWGFYHISEFYGAKYLADHFSVHENNVLMVKNGVLAEGSEEDMSLYNEMLNYIASSDMADPNSYSVACDLIDMDSFADYYAVQIYLARRHDWPHSNFALWRTIEQESVVCGDGKWRWMLFDENSMGMSGSSTDLWNIHATEPAKYDFVEDDTLGMVIGSDQLFASLWRSVDFQQLFVNRMMYIGEEVLSADKCTDAINTFFEDFGPLLQSTHKRAYDNANEALLEDYRGNMNNFFQNRYAVMKTLLERHVYSGVSLPQ